MTCGRHRPADSLAIFRFGETILKSASPRAFFGEPRGNGSSTYKPRDKRWSGASMSIEYRLKTVSWVAPVGEAV